MLFNKITIRARFFIKHLNFSIILEKDTVVLRICDILCLLIVKTLRNTYFLYLQGKIGR